MKSIDDPNLNVYQTYDVDRLVYGKGGKWYAQDAKAHKGRKHRGSKHHHKGKHRKGKHHRKHRKGAYHLRNSREILQDAFVAPNNVGPKTIPNYDAVANQAITNLPSGGKVFAGQRDDPFFVDLGATFDAINLDAARTSATGRRHRRPRRLRRSLDRAAGTRGERDHATASRSARTRTRTPSSASGPRPSASAFRSRVAEQRRRQGRRLGPGFAPRQPAGERGRHPARAQGQVQQHPAGGRRAVREVRRSTRSWRRLFNALFNLGVKETDRTDIVQALLHGRPGPEPDRPASRSTRSSSTSACRRRNPNRFGVLGGDTAGFPNGRRLTDDVVDIELRVVAGALIGNNVPLGDGVDHERHAVLDQFPYVVPTARASTRRNKSSEPRPEGPAWVEPLRRLTGVTLTLNRPLITRLLRPARGLRRDARGDPRFSTARRRRRAARRLLRRRRPRRRPAPRPTRRSPRSQATVRATPGDAERYAALGHAYLQKVRETGDAVLLRARRRALKHGAAARPARRRRADGRGRAGARAPRLRAGPALDARARTRAAPERRAPVRRDRRRAGRAGPLPATPRATLQTMVDLKPNLASYARVSYFRELHGDLAGALARDAARGLRRRRRARERRLRADAARQPRVRPRPARRGRARPTATRSPRFPGYVPRRRRARARRGRSRATSAAAIRRCRAVVARLPLPEYVSRSARPSWRPAATAAAPPRPRARRRRAAPAARRTASTPTSSSRSSRPTTARRRAAVDARRGAPGRTRRACARPTRSAGR